MSTGAILYDTNFSGIQFTPLCFGSFNAILSPRISFLFLLVFVLLVEGKGQGAPTASLIPAIHTHVTLLREGACTSSISADDWDDWFAG
jgi:hypothetical protein